MQAQRHVVLLPDRSSLAGIARASTERREIGRALTESVCKTRSAHFGQAKTLPRNFRLDASPRQMPSPKRAEVSSVRNRPDSVEHITVTLRETSLKKHVLPLPCLHQSPYPNPKSRRWQPIGSFQHRDCDIRAL